MQQAVELFGPVVEVRDVLESFLHDRVLVTDWRQRLTEASRQFIEVGDESVDLDVVELGRRVALLAKSDLATSSLTSAVAADIRRLLDDVRVPGVPRPDDEDWSF